MAGAGSGQLWAGSEVADELDLGEWAWSGGGECAESDWLASSAEKLAREHIDGDVFCGVGGVEGCGCGMRGLDC